jgi:trk system potassium uptake protein TrkA
LRNLSLLNASRRSFLRQDLWPGLIDTFLKRVSTIRKGREVRQGNLHQGSLHNKEKRKGQRPGSIVIVGCGRLGALLASHLSRSGSRVVVIDHDRDSFTLLEAGFSGFCVTGDAVEHDVLREAGLSEADCLLAVTEKDTLNLMVAQVAKMVFEVPQVIARVYNPHRVALYRRLGIETISPTSLTAREFLHMVTQKEVQP